MSKPELVFIKKLDAVNPLIIECAEGYRVVRQKMGSADRPTYYRFAAWLPGKRGGLLDVFDDGAVARRACADHYFAECG